MSSLWPSPEDLEALEREEREADEANYLKSLKGLTNLFDRAMADEGIPARFRDRVISRVLSGSPTPDSPADWAEPPEPLDLAVIDMLAEAAPEPGPADPPINALGW